MQLFHLVFFCCCFVFVIGVGDAKTELPEAGTKDLEREDKLIAIIQQLEEQMAEQNARKDERLMQMAKKSAKESEATGYQRATIKALRREKREDSTTIEKLQTQLKESRSREATVKRLKDAAFDSKSANGSLHGNSTRLAADVSCASKPPFPKAVNSKGTCLQLFLTKKTWNEARSFCKSLGGDLASLPNGNQLLHAAQTVNKYGTIWVGASCSGTEAECQRVGNTKPWKWLTGEKIPLSSPYWRGGGSDEPYRFDAPGCLIIAGNPESTQILVAEGCNTGKYEFLCQF